MAFTHFSGLSTISFTGRVLFRQPPLRRSVVVTRSVASSPSFPSSRPPSSRHLPSWQDSQKPSSRVSPSQSVSSAGAESLPSCCLLLPAPLEGGLLRLLLLYRSSRSLTTHNAVSPSDATPPVRPSTPVLRLSASCLRSLTPPFLFFRRLVENRLPRPLFFPRPSTFLSALSRSRLRRPAKRVRPRKLFASWRNRFPRRIK